METAMARRDISEGGRIAFLDEHKGWTIEVVTGYDVVSDRWPVHAYVAPPGGVREKIAVHEPIRENQNDALSHGFEAARWHIEHMVD
ncbi:hypothetical protein WM07_00915 [Burkholderia ubonensis]|nr:hypothetical protein WM07_00915 [Burkholderia ubonensis]